MPSRLILHSRVVRGMGGGPEKTILNSPRYLQAMGYDSLCAYMRHPKDFGFEEVERLARLRGARLVAVDDRGPLDWRVLGRLRRICMSYQPAFWHGHDYKSNLLGLMVSASRPMHLITTVHGWVQRTWRTPFYYAIDRRCLRLYDGVICVSHDIHEACLGMGIPAERCWLVPNAVDTEEFKRREPTASAKIRLGFDPGRYLIGAVGRLSGEKDFASPIRAVASLLADGLDLELIIAGEGPRKSELESLISRLGLQDRVKLLGYHPSVIELYNAMDVFVLSSVREGLPNVLLEAMALGLPVLCTNVAGIPGVVRDGDNGLLVEPGSTQSLTIVLKRLLEDAALRRFLGGAARETVEESYSFSDRMRTVGGIYDRLDNTGEKPGCAHTSSKRPQ